MEIDFYKYQGTGNDFVIIDNRENLFPKENTQLVAHLCDRRFGVGADGLLLLEKNATVDFTMVYYNSDGKISSMCGNGGRCISHFAKYLGIVSESVIFQAVDGMHRARVKDGWVSLKMNDVDTVETNDGFAFLNTGSPHHVQEISDLENFDVFSQGRDIRYGRYETKGANINFVQQLDTDSFSVRTYERGVENETLSCGTGVTAVAIAMFEMGKTSHNQIKLKTPGGQLVVRFEKQGTSYVNIYLEGPAVQVFKGNLKWQL